MNTKIFLQEFKSKQSSNTSEGLNVSFKGRRKLLPLNGIDETLSQYEQYKKERESSNIIRLTCQVNPVCSNVLFNQVTEIVHNEGSSAVTFLNYHYSPSNNEVFQNVLNKPKLMDFWSGGDMNYQSVDNDVVNQSANTKLSDITSTTHFSDGQIKSNVEHPTNAIRDTQLSKKDIGFVYHCGLDFLNNHLVRSNTFKAICKCPDDLNINYTAFNTIADLMRSVNGNKVIEKVYFPTSEASLQSKEYTKLLSLHLYETDDILTYKRTVEKKIVSNFNGWVGFYNKPKIKSYLDFSSGTSMEIERPLSYLNSGDFVDMYPGRDLYSFIPKYNNFQKRIEKNWNYCLTYPSSSYTPSSSADPFVDIIEINNGINSLKTVYFDENTRSDNGTQQLVLYSISKHGLSVDDYVNIYSTYDTMLYWVEKRNAQNKYERISIEYEDEGKAQDEMTILEVEDPGEYRLANSGTEVTVTHKVIDNARVSEIVDDYIFVVFGSDIQISNKWVSLSKDELDRGWVEIDGEVYSIDRMYGRYFTKASNIETNIENSAKYYIVNGNYVNFDDKAQKISYKKTYGDIECDYYIRIFSKLPNFKFASGDTSSEYEIYKEQEGGSMLSVYQGKEYDFENHISKLAFAKNIYSDGIGEIVFTDDIDISNIHDNLGRPLTSLYLTFAKNNKGYKEWYGWNGQVPNWEVSAITTEFQNIEYSHCFGPVTCGIKTSDESIYDSTIHCINRINNRSNNVGYDISRINGNRTYKSSENSDIMIDDNEVWYDLDKHYYGDLCCFDNYYAIEQHIQYVNHRFNTAQREIDSGETYPYFRSYVYDEIKCDDYDAGDSYEIGTTTVNDCNKLVEGYYYIPHYEIPIKTFGKLQTISPDFLTIRQIDKNDNNDSNDTYKIVTLEQHFLGCGDKAVIYDSVNEKYYKLIVINAETNNYKVFSCKVYDEETNKPTIIDNMNIYDLKLFKMDNLDIPSYARILKDGTCRLIWRDVFANGMNKDDKSVEEYPFTNGALYVNRKIDIYVRRQDPHGKYLLYNSKDIEGEITNASQEDNYVKQEDIIC